MSQVAKYAGFMIWMTEDAAQQQKWIDRTIASLELAYDGPIYLLDPKEKGGPTDEIYLGTWLQNYASAYDWVQPFLTEEQDEAIRGRLIKQADWMKKNIYQWTERPQMPTRPHVLWTLEQSSWWRRDSIRRQCHGALTRIGRTVRNGSNFTESGFGIRGALGTSDRDQIAASQLKPGDVDWDHIFGVRGVRWLHTGEIFAALSGSAAAVTIEAVRAAKRHGTIVSYDLNYRPQCSVASATRLPKLLIWPQRANTQNRR